MNRTMNPPQRADHGGALASTVHLEFIRNQAELGDGEGLEGVESYHRALFLNHHAGDLERSRQQGRIHGDRLAYLEKRLKDTQTRLAQVDKLVPVSVDGEPDLRPTSPWNVWDRSMFAIALLGIVALLVFGVLNVSFNLLESGLVTFMENPVRAYFWAALLPVGALAVKVGWDALQSQRRRELYLWTCLAMGLAGVIVWVAAYASVYPTLSKTTEDHIQSLSVYDETGGESPLTSGGAKRIDMAIVVAQAAAEIFLSAVLGMYLTLLYTRHRPVRLANNPLFHQVDEERRSLEDTVARERVALAEAKGQECRLEHQLAAFVALAKSMFQKEAALRREQSHQQKTLLDQISNQLRNHLRGVGNGDAATSDEPLPRLVEDRQPRR